MRPWAAGLPLGGRGFWLRGGEGDGGADEVEGAALVGGGVASMATAGSGTELVCG